MIYSIAEILSTISDVIMLIWFVNAFNRTKTSERPWTLVFPAALLAFQLLGDKLFAGFDLIYALGFFVLSVLYAVFKSRRKYLRAVLSVCLYMAVTLLFSSLFGALFGLYLDDISVIMQGAQTPARIAYVAMSKLVYIAVYYLILHFFGSGDSIDLKNSLYVFAFTLITSIGLGLLMNLNPTAEDERLKYSVFILILVLIVSNTMVYFMIYEIQKLLKNRYELKLMREKMAFEEKRTEEANAIWDNIRKVRHDMKNHLAVISGKLEGGDTDGCKSYLQNLSSTVESMGDLI